MAIVTVRGQLGSGAPEIGKLIADKLHADYIDREIIAKVAELLNSREEAVIEKEMPPGSLLGRVATILRHIPSFNIDLSEREKGISYPKGLKIIIEELALNQPIVIRGRGAQFILKHWPGALHVLFVSPLKLRMRRVMLDMKIEETDAKNEIARFDNSRREFIKKYFKAELEDPQYYDLVINTGRMSFEAAASIVVNTLPLKN